MGAEAPDGSEQREPGSGGEASPAQPQVEHRDTVGLDKGPDLSRDQGDHQRRNLFRVESSDGFVQVHLGPTDIQTGDQMQDTQRFFSQSSSSCGDSIPRAGNSP